MTKEIDRVDETENIGTATYKNQVKKVSIKTVKTYYKDGSNDCKVFVNPLDIGANTINPSGE